ncbi:RHS repeat-associated core domain-containing protein [Pedobacter psychrodurus]|uniref:RHS repeat domain-containing protein n=1 Tax=Pedobacter psychrodurus TaxID=2530456 RepID=UPI00293010DA|nr:RHS repeat-associated core domain-containing protein [Pedobacter psychrodurus]
MDWTRAPSSPSAVFAERLQYAEGSLPQYNGNIAQLSWQTVVPAGLSLFQGVQSFSYEYDKVHRLRKAVYTTPGNLNRFNEELSYDLRGNILTLNRTNSTAANTFLNKFVYTYSSGTNTGNKLLSLEDTGTANQDGSYQYDDNGNVSVDSRNLVTGISYNYLNLPNTVTRSTGSINYTYIAGGNKVKKVPGAMTRDYIDGIEYSNGSLEFIPTEEGRAVPSGRSFVYEYFLRDHLGNTRAGIKQDGGIIQVQDYYAFGLDMNPGNAYIGSTLNNYKYNNKEKQEELGQYDYGARFYDPVIGRWNVIDPLAEVNRRWSPYRYAYDNPVRYIDADGMIERDPATGKIIFTSSGNSFTRDATNASGTYSLTYQTGTIRTDKKADVLVDKLSGIKFTDKDGKITLIDIENSTSVNGIPISQFMANCHGLTLGDGEFVIDAEGAGKILRDEYTDLGISDKGSSGIEVPDHDVMTVGGSTIGDVWEPFHSATSKPDGYTSKNDIGPVRKKENRQEATNYVKYDKGTDGFNQIMDYLRRYFKKNEKE